MVCSRFQDVELDGVPGESPYIGKARYKRNTYAVESYVPDEALKIQTGNVEQEEQPNIQQLKRNLLRSLDEQLQEKQRKIKEGKCSPVPTTHYNPKLKIGS